MATDALIEGIEDNRAATAMLANTLARLTNGGWLKLNRLGDSLLQVAQTSPLHAYAVSETLQSWVTLVDLKQRNMYRILEVMLEVQMALNAPLSSPAKELLKLLGGSSKAAKIAKRMVEIEPKESSLINRIKLKLISDRLDETPLKVYGYICLTTPLTASAANRPKT